MRAVPVLLLLWPAAAGAQDAARHAWGRPVEDSAPSVVSLEACDPPCAAVVRFDNTLVITGTTSPVTVRATLALGGVAVAVAVEHGGGMTPDLLRVVPPPGYAAEPGEVLVDDNATGHVRVMPVPMS